MIKVLLFCVSHWFKFGVWQYPLKNNNQARNIFMRNRMVLKKSHLIRNSSFSRMAYMAHVCKNIPMSPISFNKLNGSCLGYKTGYASMRESRHNLTDKKSDVFHLRNSSKDTARRGTYITSKNNIFYCYSKPVILFPVQICSIWSCWNIWVSSFNFNFD